MVLINMQKNPGPIRVQGSLNFYHCCKTQSLYLSRYSFAIFKIFERNVSVCNSVFEKKNKRWSVMSALVVRGFPKFELVKLVKYRRTVFAYLSHKFQNLI